jgi:hypothetical protein
VKELGSVRHVRLAEPLLIKMNGKENRGVILKPGAVQETPGINAIGSRSSE